MTPRPPAIKLERNPLGPRLFLYGRRAHEWHLGLAVAVADAAALACDLVPGGSHAAAAAFVLAVWLIAKDWRDLAPGRRDTAAWQLGFHRPPAPLRVLRHGDSLPALAGAVAALIAVFNLVPLLDGDAPWHDRLYVGAWPLSSVPHFGSSALPAGVALALFAVGLLYRRRAAWALTLVVLVALSLAELARDLDPAESAAGLAAAALVWSARGAFYVRGCRPLREALRSVLALVVAGCVATELLTMLVVDAGPGASARVAMSVVLSRPLPPISGADGAGALPPLAHVLWLLVLVGSAYVLLRRPDVDVGPPDPAARRSAHALVRAYGSDTLAFFKLRSDLQYMFDRGRDAFLAYRIESGVLLLCGDPVGTDAARQDLLRDACVFAEEHGLRVAAVSVGPDLLPTYERAGLRSFYIGDEAIVDTSAFSLEGRAIRKVRQSVARLERAGYGVELTRLGRLPAADVAELERVAERWRDGQPDRGFSMALGSLSADDHGETLVVAARDAAGTIRAFLHFAPVYGRDAVSLSAMCRERETPNGLIEFLVVHAIELLGARGIRDVSLNFAAFARVLHAPRSRTDRLLACVIRRFDPYFQIESLYRFNAKFSPRWEPRYLVYEGRFGFPRAALATLFVEGQLRRPTSPPALARAASKARRLLIRPAS